MPTHIPSKSYAAARLMRVSERVDSSQSDDMTVVLLWTATGLAISLGLLAFGMAPDIAESLLMLG